MRSTDKMRDLTLKNMIILVTYIAGLILCLIYFKNIMGFIGQLIGIIKPFIIGFVLAFIFNIPMKYFIKKLPIQKEKTKKLVAAILSILLVFLVLTLIIMVVLPQVIENVRMLPSIFAQIEEWLNYFLIEVHLSADVMVKIEKFQQNLGQTILAKLSTWVPSIALGVSHYTTTIVNIFMGFVMAVYMLLSKDKLLKQVKRVGNAFLSDQQFRQVNEVLRLTSKTFENFLAGQLTESVIIGVLCYIGCVILDIPYASIAAVVIGFTNIIPYFGPIIGAVLSSVLIIFVSPIKAVIFLIFSTLLQQFESNLIYPHVVGSSVGLSALWVLFAVSAGGGMFGIPGMVFGLPTFSVIYELMRRWTNQRLKEKNTKSGLSEG